MGIQGKDPPTIESGATATFQGFGRSLIHATARRPLQHLAYARDLAIARREIRQQVPCCPGVYGWLNRDGTLIYVGKSKSLRHRLVTYFAAETSDPKMSKIRRHSRRLVWEPLSHELLALIREQELITRLRPPYNVHGKPERQQPGFICISGGLAPTLFFARDVPRRAAHTFGPIAGRARLSEAIACLNYVFQLRDCPDKIKMQFSNQLQLFENEQSAQCLRFELKTCPAPCAGHCSRETYDYKVGKALRFLRGHDYRILGRLQQRMQQAAEQFSFERAGVLRDQWQQLQWLQRRIQQLKKATRRLNGVWILPGFDHGAHWMILRQGQLLESTAGPADPRSMLACEQARTAEVLVPQTHLQINLLMLLTSWIKKHPQQLGTLVPFEDIPQLFQGLRGQQRSA